MRRYFAALAGALLLMGSLGGCGNGRQERVDQSHFAMDTYINISVYRAEDKAAAAACFDLMDRWDQMLSVTSETGEIAVLNRDGHARLSHDTIALVEKALECADLTNGAFDPTLLPLKNLWRIGERSADEPLPSREEIAAAQGATGYGKVALSGNAITLSPGMGLDLGAIAKGYVADLCAQYLLDHGVSMGIINMGGNVRLLGGKDYNVGVRDPRGSENQLLLTINTRDCSIVTSGDYERYFEKDGVRYHHIFDPKRGYPADTDLMAVTVIGSDGALCDALSTAFFVIGLDGSVTLMEHKGLDVDVIFVTIDQRVLVTPGIRDRITMVNNTYTLETLP